ncbi:hypothetical protein QTP70_013556 [Hemibagrus guttatus]|uniref:Uncharacterized protein n=1 Tax=Hemibagrus guttatus TaxID=175788 RepID=A0AAE0PU84_9TELE|nr:hypothetical protein QTP70_013556 [Hemibagrus guttatus]
MSVSLGSGTPQGAGGWEQGAARTLLRWQQSKFLAVSTSFSLESMAAQVRDPLDDLTRSHGVRVVTVAGVEECCLAAGEVVGHRNVLAASRMNSALVLFVNTVENAVLLTQKGLVLRGSLTDVLSLSTPAKKVTLSNVPPFISSKMLERQLSIFAEKPETPEPTVAENTETDPVPSDGVSNTGTTVPTAQAEQASPEQSVEIETETDIELMMTQIWRHFKVQRATTTDSLHWLLQEPLVYGACLDVGDSSPSQSLLTSGVTTLKHLVHIAGPRLKNDDGVAAQLGVRSKRVVSQLLRKWTLIISREEREMLTDYCSGTESPDPEDPFPELALSVDCGQESTGHLLDSKNITNVNCFNVSGKTVYKACVKAFIKRSLRGRVDTPWCFVLSLSEGERPE